MRHAIALLVVQGFFAARPLAVDVSSSTLANLQAAFEAESNSAARSYAFAAKADEEGFGDVARVFRAVGDGEQIHARHHAEVIRALGAEPRAVIGPVTVRSTRENLDAAIAQDRFDLEARYPTVLAEAREIGDATPMSTLRLALIAERMHVRLLETAVLDLADARRHRGPFTVCQRCGHVVEPPAMDARRAPTE